jgi:hypothetical protein
MERDAEQLNALPSQWYAVSYFYAAYHTVRAALMEDAIFSDLPRLKAHDPHWTPDDRRATHHQARKSRTRPNPPGVNDLVKALYPQIAIEYVQLHSASVAVRYGLGLSGYDPSALASAYQTIASAAGAGDLTAA